MEVMLTSTRGLELRTRVVTQTLTRPATTITAVVTLGDGPTSPPTPTLTLPTTSPSSSSIPITPAPSASLSPSQLGALLGSVFGLVFLALLVCCCFTIRRRRRQRTEYYDEDYISESEMAQNETFIGGTPEWNLPHHHHQRGRASTGTWTTVPPPVRFPPTPRYTTYSQTREPQIRGVRRFP